MFRIAHVSSIAFVASGILSMDASAQVVVVTFNGGASPIPLPHWLTPLIAIVLLVTAYKSLRTCSGVRRGTTITLILSAAALIGNASVPWLREARADGFDVLQLFASPARYSIPQSAIFNMIQSGAGYGFAVENRTGSAITIAGRSFEDDPNHWLYFYVPAPPVPPPECAPGLTLSSGDHCYIWVASTVHW